ncbi:MAG: dTDP-glucose 4,6-dehydratase [bacterium]
MKRILVTGGCGFIGSNFIRYLIGKDYFICNLDKLTYAGNLENLSGIAGKKNYSFVKGDINDPKIVERIISDLDIEVVINFAAESHVDRSILGPEIFTRTNVLGTQVLLDVSRNYWSKKGFKGKKFIQISTDEVYGSLGKTGKFKENTPLSPNSPYSASKAAADHLVNAYHHTFGFPSIISRCSNNYGPYQFPEKLIPLMIIKALQNKPLPVYGDGLNVRDWLHVEDHCSAIELILEKGKIGEVYNIGGNNEWKNIDVVKLILSSLHRKGSLIEHVKDRPGHDRRYAMDAGKIMKELGWKPKYKFEEGLKSTIKWYLDTRDWWGKIISGEYKNYYNKAYKNR